MRQQLVSWLSLALVSLVMVLSTASAAEKQLVEDFEDSDVVLGVTSTQGIAYETQNAESPRAGEYSLKIYPSTCGSSCHDTYRVELSYAFGRPIYLKGIGFWVREGSTSASAWGGKINVGFDLTWEVYWWEVVPNGAPITNEWVYRYVPINAVATTAKLWVVDISSQTFMWLDDIVIEYDPGVEPKPPVPGTNIHYTTDAEFDLGTLVSVNHDYVHDQLQLDSPLTTFAFIWIALTGRDTVVKVDTATGAILGEYLSAPDGREGNPSRTTVDLNGAAWVGNRDAADGNKGSAVHIGLVEMSQCVDRNGNGSIETSTGLGDVRPWPNTGGADNNGGVSTAEDECIIHYVRAGGGYTRHVSVDANNNVWIGGNNDYKAGNRILELVDGNTGAILRTIGPFSCGGYGGLVDNDGILWSASGSPLDVGTLRYDPIRDEARCVGLPGSYGLGIDNGGNIWNSRWNLGSITKLWPDGSVIGTFSTNGGNSGGVAVTDDDHVWVANRASNTVTRLDNAGILRATIGVGSGPTGVSVDAAGKVWVTNMNSHNAMRINPASNSVDLTVGLGAGAAPYNYSDMTGAVSRKVTVPQGTWMVVQDSGGAGTSWGMIEWNTEEQGREPLGTSISAEMRTAENVAGLGAIPYTAVSNGAQFAHEGRFIQVRVTLRPDREGVSPVLSDIRIAASREECPTLACEGARAFAGGNVQLPVLFNPGEFSVASSNFRVEYDSNALSLLPPPRVTPGQVLIDCDAALTSVVEEPPGRAHIVIANAPTVPICALDPGEFVQLRFGVSSEASPGEYRVCIPSQSVVFGSTTGFELCVGQTGCCPIVIPDCLQGDCNCNGFVDGGDIVCLISKFFCNEDGLDCFGAGAGSPFCDANCPPETRLGVCPCEDCNLSGRVNAADAPCITLCAFGTCPDTTPVQ